MTHNLIRAAGLGCFPCWTRPNSKTGRYDKGPAVPSGVSWKDAATQPAETFDWSTGVIGIPIPAHVLVIDLDSYKNPDARQDVETYLGCPLPWDAALIQRTISGGEHYAFRVSIPCRQVSPDAVTGFDTRAAGAGFICAGTGYTACGPGPVAMAIPALLPELPAPAQERLARPEPPAPPAAAHDLTHDQTVDALKHVDPGCNRAEWVRVGMALRDAYRDDEAAGREVFDQWSSGALWSGDAPVNYVAEHIDGQWSSFKPDGDVTAATLFYKAIQNGWQPPSDFSTSDAFAPVATYQALVDQIRRDAADVASIPGLVDAIRQAGCSPLQVALLAAEIKTELRSAGVKDKTVEKQIDGVLAAPPPPRVAGQYGDNDALNATTFMETCYPTGGILYRDEVIYTHNGRSWDPLTNADFDHQVASAMHRHAAQLSKVQNCASYVRQLAPRYRGGMDPRPHDAVFHNGVLDVKTGEVRPHDAGVFHTTLLPYDWSPSAGCPQWLAFLSDVFDGDQERIALLQEWFGYMMVRSYRHQKIMFFLGPTRSGKGTIGRMLKSIVGAENFSGGSLSKFTRDSFVASLQHKTVLFIGDAESKFARHILPSVIERLKTISGHDDVSFDRKYKSELSEPLPTRITVAANSIPALFDDSGALASRMLVLPFYNSYLNKEDLDLDVKLSSELAGVAAWAVEGYRRLDAQGRFTLPEASAAETADLEETYSPMVLFVSEVMSVGPSERVSAQEAHDRYVAWSVASGDQPVSRKVFTRSLKDLLRGQGVKYCVLRIGGEVIRGFTGIGIASATPVPDNVTAGAFRQ